MRPLAAELAKRRQAQLYRIRRTLDGQTGPEAVCEGRRYLTFCSNDYLGLAAHPALAKALAEGAARYGTGAGAAHLVSGHSRAHHALEEELADFVGYPRALLFSTGYMANLGVVTALVGAGDALFEDRLNHASLIDAGLLSRARFQRYLHRDATALARRLERAGTGARLVVTDGVFSMDGDLAPVPALVETARRHGAGLMVDDAHGLGAIGATGRGTLEQLGVAPGEVDVLVGTFGKAFGTFGAFAAGSEELVETLIQQARSYIYTTATPPALAEATRASLRLVQAEAWRRDRLAASVARFRAGATQLGLPLMESTTAIQPLLVGEAAAAMALSDALLERGIWISAIRPPTVPAGSARLRITLSAAHSDEQVDRLLEALGEVYATNGGGAG